MNKRQLKVILSVIPKNNVRYFLNGLYVDFDKNEVAATNGHILVVVKDVKGLNGSGSIIIPRDAVELVAKTKTKNLIQIMNTKVSVDDFSFEFKPVEGKYPDYSTVIPPDEDVKNPGHFDFYRSEYIKVLEDLELAFEVGPIFHRPNKKGTPLKATFSAKTGERVISCVMPMSVKTTETDAAMKACIYRIEQENNRVN